MIDKKYLNHALNLVYFNRRLDKRTFIKVLLEDYKKKRKNQGVSGTATKRAFLDVYEKLGVPAASILEQLIERKWLTTNKDGYITFTGLGELELKAFYTNHYCAEYQDFEKSVNDLTAKYYEPDFNELFIMSMYWRGWSLEFIDKHYFQNDSTSYENLHKTFQQVNDLIVEEDDYIFHIQPKIFLDWDDIDAEVKLTIEGLDEVPAFHLIRPYPNKRYVVATLASNKTKELRPFGWYAIHGKKDSFPTTKIIRFIWKIGNYKDVIHDLELEFIPGRGNLFSTMQYTRRGCSLESFRICSTSSFETATELTKNLKTSSLFECDAFLLDEKELFVINEQKHLTSIPIHLHHIY